MLLANTNGFDDEGLGTRALRIIAGGDRRWVLAENSS